MKGMKLLCPGFMALILAGCTALGALLTLRDPVIASLGEPSRESSYTYGGFQDYTDYGVYVFDAPELEENPYFRAIDQEDLEMLQPFLEDYESWVECHRKDDPEAELVVNYDFDPAVIGAGDWYYLETRYPDKPLHCYDLYLLDVDTGTLYYLHNNI